MAVSERLRQSVRRARRTGWKPAPPPRRPVLFVNPRSGGGAAQRAGVADHARARGVRTVVLEQGQSLSKLVEGAVAEGVDALGIAGGDGSIAVVAAAARREDLPLICIPAGTRNHFAADLGIQRSDLVGALDAFTDGMERRIDVGEVNGRMFLNNVCLGVYGEAVRQEAYRDAKLRTLIETANAVRSASTEAVALSVVDGRGREHPAPAVVIVSNNAYAIRTGRHGARPALDRGQLGVILIDAPGTGPPGPGVSWTAADLEIQAEAQVHAGLDGEAVDLDPPLRFAVRPAALRVRISRSHADAAPLP
jgi:diacylglycerol kinase family enzyme